MLKAILMGVVLLGTMGSLHAVWADEMPAAAIFQSPQAPQAPASVAASSSCPVFKWDRACSSNSEQECHASCGSCTMCLDVMQFYPCIYECSCAC